jgi:hypothetical protein
MKPLGEDEGGGFLYDGNDNSEMKQFPGRGEI